MGADPIATAIAIVSEVEGKPIPAFLVRAERKDHGLRNLISHAQPTQGDGDAIAPGRRVAVVDDVATTGQSCLDAIDAVEQAGATVVKVIVLVDRQQGAAETFSKRGTPFEALFVADADGILSEWNPPVA
jgi:orotate phosphoribosyltransferase